MYLGKATKRFLEDENRNGTHIKLNCLKLHIPGSNGYIESIPSHLGKDLTMFPIYDLIASPSNVTYIKGGKWSFDDYVNIEKLFTLVCRMDSKLIRQ